MIKETFVPVNFPIDGQELGPMLIFKDLTPIYLKVNFLKWCEIGLAEVGASRQLEASVIKHMQTEFVGLLNAVHCIALTIEDEEKIEENYNLYADNYYKKDAKSILDPFDFSLAFFRGITRESAKSILWLLMEVVTANKDKYEYMPGQTTILSLYERFAAIIDVGYKWHKTTKEYKQSKKKPGPKNNKKRKR